MVKSNQVLDSLNALHCVLTELVVGYFLDLKGKERSSDPNTSVKDCPFIVVHHFNLIGCQLILCEFLALRVIQPRHSKLFFLTHGMISIEE